MDVNPVIREWISVIENKCHNNEITVLERLCCIKNDPGWFGRHSLHKLRERHGKDEIVTPNELGAVAAIGLGPLNLHCNHSTALMKYAADLRPHPHPRTARDHTVTHTFPHHPGSEPWILEG
jgi:hypothetical protein